MGSLYIGEHLISVPSDIELDAVPTEGSENAVTSGGVYSAIETAIEAAFANIARAEEVAF